MNKPVKIQCFSTVEEARQYIYDLADDPCVDNFRCTVLTDRVGMAEYADSVIRGCCGFKDMLVMIGGEAALIGCNYGH